MICKRVFPAILVTLLAGCTSGYVARPAAQGSEIFAETCQRCHAPVAGSTDRYFELAENERNREYVIAKVREGSLRMPKFPGISDQQLQSLAEFVLTHSGAG